MALVALPGLVGKSSFPEDSEEFVAIGEFGHHRTGHAGIGLRHQALQLRAAGGEVLALGLQMLAVVEIVFGGIGEGCGDVVAHIGAAAKADAEREHRRRRGGAQQGLGKGNAKGHATLVNRQACDCLKQPRVSGLRLCFKGLARLLKSAFSLSPTQFQSLRKRAKYLIWRPKRTWRNW